MSAPPSKPAFAHVPALDGLRGLAVALVLAFHLGLLRGGFLGVDVFFVLSGFLITSILLVERERDGRVSLARFWARRARRLLPALFALLLAVAAYAHAFVPARELERLRGDAFATLAYFANWRAIAIGDDYWSLFRAPSPLEHCWSLAIEEQLYVVWPLVVVVTAKLARRRRRALSIVALALAALSFASMIARFDPRASTARVYYGTDTRAFALLLGAALATHTRAPSSWRPSARAASIAGAVATVVLLASSFFFDGASTALYRGGFLAVAVATATIVFVVATSSGLLTRLLSIAPLRALGVVSYGVYLWHWPVFVAFGRVSTAPIALVAGKIGVTLAIAVVSYVVIERPIRRGAFAGRRMLALGPIATVTVALAIAASTADAVTPPPAGLDAPAAALPIDPKHRRVLLVGDSIARSLEGDSDRVVNRGVVGCGLIRGTQRIRLPDGKITVRARCPDWETAWPKDLDETRPAVVVLVVGAPSIGDLDMDNRWLHPCDADFDAAYLRLAARAVDVLSSRGAAVLLATAPYVDEHEDFATNRARTDCVNRAITTAALRSPHAEILDLARHVCPTRACVEREGGVLLRPDGTHYAMDSARLVRGFIEGEIARLPIDDLRSGEEEEPR